MLKAQSLIFGGGPIPSHKINFEVSPGQILLISGPSGIGKTTLLNIISGFVPPVSGDLLLDNKSLLNKPVWERPISLLFQAKNLFNHMSCRENLRLSFSPNGWANEEQDHLIEQTLLRLGIDHLIDRMPPSLSGGEEQRVALARALLKQDQIILLDEPFSALDKENRINAIDFIKKIATQHNRSILAVSHNSDDATKLGASVLDLTQTRTNAQ